MDDCDLPTFLSLMETAWDCRKNSHYVLVPSWSSKWLTETDRLNSRTADGPHSCFRWLLRLNIIKLEEILPISPCNDRSAEWGSKKNSLHWASLIKSSLFPFGKVACCFRAPRHLLRISNELCPLSQWFIYGTYLPHKTVSDLKAVPHLIHLCIPATSMLSCLQCVLNECRINEQPDE